MASYDPFDPAYWTEEAKKAWETGGTYKAPIAPAPIMPTYTPQPAIPQGALVYDPNEYAAVDPYLDPYAQRQAQAELVTSKLQAPPTQFYGGVPSYQEQLNRVQSLSAQYPWLKSYLETGVSAPVETAQYQPKVTTRAPSATTSLTDTIKQYLGEVPFFAPQPAYAAEGQPISKLLTEESITGTAGRSLEATQMYDTLTKGWSDFEGLNTKQQEQSVGATTQGMLKGWVTPQDLGTASSRLQLESNIGLVEQGEVRPDFYEAQNDQNLAQWADVIAKNNLAPEYAISNERLDAIQDNNALAGLWDTGYKAPKVVNAAMSSFANFQSQTNVPLLGIEDPQKISQIKFNSLLDAIQDLADITPDEIAAMIEKGQTWRLDTDFVGFDAMGNAQFSAVWEKETPYKSPQQKEKESDVEYWAERQKDYERYWDIREVENRNKQRQESWEWSHNKDLEGWSEYYAMLDVLKLTPYMNEYFSSAAMFNELRRRWETTGGGLDWADWLKKYDFVGKWYEQRPSERGEKPTAYAPMLTSMSRL